MNFRHKFVWTGAGILLVALAQSGSIVWAQSPVLSASAVAAPNSGAAVDAEPNAVRLLVGRSTVLDVGTPIARVSLTSAEVADALVTSPSQLLINGKMPGTISMFVWDRGGALRRYELTVQRDLALLAEQMKQLFPNEGIAVHANGKNVVLTGNVSNKDVIEKAVNVAAGTKIDNTTDKDKPVPVSVVTLLVNPDEAERLTLAASEGKIQLALRNPLDRSAPATRGVRPAVLLGSEPATRVVPSPRAAAASVARATALPVPEISQPTVEIIRGDKRAHEVVR